MLNKSLSIFGGNKAVRKNCSEMFKDTFGIKWTYYMTYTLLPNGNSVEDYDSQQDPD